MLHEILKKQTAPHEYTAQYIPLINDRKVNEVDSQDRVSTFLSAVQRVQQNPRVRTVWFTSLLAEICHLNTQKYNNLLSQGTATRKICGSQLNYELLL